MRLPSITKNSIMFCSNEILSFPVYFKYKSYIFKIITLNNYFTNYCEYIAVNATIQYNIFIEYIMLVCSESAVVKGLFTPSVTINVASWMNASGQFRDATQLTEVSSLTQALMLTRSANGPKKNM